MATFVLVHGAWHGGWCWVRARRAYAAGHHVFAAAHRPRHASICRARPSISPPIADVVNLLQAEAEANASFSIGHRRRRGDAGRRGNAHRSRRS